MMFLYVYSCMDINIVTSYVIKLQYVIWVSCYYAIMWLCYHEVMMTYEMALNTMIIVNIVMSCVIKLHYAVYFHDVFLVSRSFIINIVSSSIIKLHEKYVFFQWVFEVYV